MMTNWKTAIAVGGVLGLAAAAVGCVAEQPEDARAIAATDPASDESAGDEVDQEKKKPLKYRFYARIDYDHRANGWIPACPDADIMSAWVEYGTPAAVDKRRCGFGGAGRQAECEVVAKTAKYQGKQVCWGHRKLLNCLSCPKHEKSTQHLYELYR
jgi:Zn ribbon nucleic-acid-binding protein